MRTYNYTISEIMQFIAEYLEMDQIIKDYKKVEGVDNISEEDFINIFGESIIYPNKYYARPGMGYDFAYISDYDWHLLKNGFDPFTGEFSDDLNTLEDYILNEMDTIEPSDVAHDLCWTNSNLTFDQALEQASIMDRHYLIVDDHNNIIGSGLYYVGDNIEDYYRIKGFYDVLEYDFMKVDDPDRLTEGELESSLADDLEYYLSIRSKVLDFSATDISEVMHLLEKRFDETIYGLRIYFNIGNRKFLITGTFEPDIFYYTINLVSEGTTGNRITFLTDTTYEEYIPWLLEYYIKTDFQLDLDF